MFKKFNIPTAADVLLLVILTIIIYWPVSFCIYSLKNDSLIQYLPFRYHLSESIQQGYFPFWTPYLYTGLPIHADMQGMTWNPIVLMLSLFTKYNMSTLQLELTIYLVLTALSMYSLLKSFSLHRLICITGAVSYMSCGFMTGSASIIPWISSAAFIPFVFQYLREFILNPQLNLSIKLAVASSLLFLCGYPTFYIFTFYICLTLLITSIFIRSNSYKNWFSSKSILYLVAGLVVFLAICSPAIISYAEFLPYYRRGSGISLATAAQNPFTPFASLSYLFPGTALMKHSWLATDISMKNTYVGLFIFVLFIISLFSKLKGSQKLILIVTAISFFLSLGDYTPLHKLFYSFVPLFDSFRHPGNFRLFTSIGVILLAALFAQNFSLARPNELKDKFLPAIYSLFAFFAFLLVYLLIATNALRELSELVKGNLNEIPLSERLSFNSWLVLETILQLVFVLVLYGLLVRNKLKIKTGATLLIANSVLFCWLVLPFTFISKVKTRDVNAYMQTFPAGYPLPDINQTPGTYNFPGLTKSPQYGFEEFYTKEIAIHNHAVTPTLNKAYEDFCSDTAFRFLLRDYTFVYLADTILKTTPHQSTETNFTNRRLAVCAEINSLSFTDSSKARGSIKLKEFNPNNFGFETETNHPSFFVIFQQYNHNWNIKINGRASPVYKTNTAFMGTPLQAGKNLVEFFYDPVKVKKAMYLSGSIILILLVWLIFSLLKNANKVS